MSENIQLARKHSLQKPEIMLLTCGCLNVKLHTKTPTNYSLRKDLPAEYQKEEFFQHKLQDIEICEPGISLEHSYLIHKRHIGEWIIHKCLICGITTHAIGKSRSSRVLISDNLQTDASVVERLRKSADFSSAFGVVLQAQDSGYITSMPDPSSGNYESLQSHLSDIQQQLSNFLLTEESAMESRIRQYEEEEKAKFRQLQSKVKSDKKKFISLLLQNEDGDKSSNAKHRNPGSIDEGRSPRLNIPQGKTPLGRIKSTPIPRVRNSDEFGPEAMFMLDDAGPEDDQPFYMSDEEDDEEDDDHAIEIPKRLSGGFKKQRSVYSSSVPISVPIFGRGDQGNSTEEDGTPQNPDQIAASMQALAQSINNDERYIFGDRPRPRLNTGDFKH